MFPFSLEKWHHCISYRHQRNGPLSGPAREDRRLAKERQWGMPAEARAERTVPRANLPCNLGPTLFAFSVTWGYFSCCSSWGETESRIGLQSFVSRLVSAESPALLGTTACTAGTALVTLRQPPEVLFLPASLLSERWVGLLLASWHLILCFLHPSGCLPSLAKLSNPEHTDPLFVRSAWQIHRHSFRLLGMTAPQDSIFSVPRAVLGKHPIYLSFSSSALGCMPFTSPWPGKSPWLKWLVTTQTRNNTLAARSISAPFFLCCPVLAFVLAHDCFPFAAARLFPHCFQAHG